MKIQNKYIPGVCNIGEEEIKMRRNVGVAFLALTILLEIYFLYKPMNHIIEISSIFIIFFVAMLGFLQARAQFCVNLGLAGLFNFAEIGKSETVSQKEYRDKDRKNAWKIILQSALLATILAILLALI